MYTVLQVHRIRTYTTLKRTYVYRFHTPFVNVRTTENEITKRVKNVFFSCFVFIRLCRRRRRKKNQQFNSVFVFESQIDVPRLGNCGHSFASLPSLNQLLLVLCADGRKRIIRLCNRFFRFLFFFFAFVIVSAWAAVDLTAVCKV